MQSLLLVLLTRFWRKYCFSFGYIEFSVFDVNGISLLSLDRDYFLFIFFFIYVSWFWVLSFVRSRRFWALCSLNIISLWLFCLFSPSGNLTGCICIRLFAEHLFLYLSYFSFPCLFTSIYGAEWYGTEMSQAHLLVHQFSLQVCLICSLTHPLFSFTFHNYILSF